MVVFLVHRVILVSGTAL